MNAPRISYREFLAIRESIATRTRKPVDTVTLEQIWRVLVAAERKRTR